ncbi:MAG: SNF2-related protein, partial [Saprospiraceae bacterium]
MPQVSVVFNLYPFSDGLFLPNAYIVAIEPSGTPTHIVQKATRDTIASYGIPLVEPLSALFLLLDALQPKNIEARFKPPKSRQIPALAQLIDDPKTKSAVLKYIHEQLDRLLQLLVHHRLPIALDAEKRTLVKDVLLSMPTDDVVPHIAFRKTDAGVEYRLQLGTEMAPWRISQRDVIPLTNTDPAWLTAGYTLLHVPGINGYMVKPFQQKDVVHIPPEKVQLYFRQFIAKAAGRTLIDAEGFELALSNTLMHIRLEPVEHLLENTWYLKTIFVYDGAEFAWGDKRTQVTTVHFDAENHAALHQVRRDQRSEDAGLARLLELHLEAEGRLLKPQGQNGVNACLQWISQNRETLQAEGFAVQPLTLDGKVLAHDAPSIALETVADGDWFDVQGRVRVGEHHFPFKALAPWIRRGDRYFPLPNGTFFLIPEEWFARYAEVVSEAEDGPGEALLVRKALFTLLDKAGLTPAEGARFPVVDPEEVAFEVPTELRATLRLYQLTGVKWLVGHYREGFGACLADDMGLGKTLQTIALLLHVKTVTAASVAERTVTATSVADKSVTATSVADKTVTATSVADKSITTTSVADKSTSATKVADTKQLNLFQAHQDLLRPLNAL